MYQSIDIPKEQNQAVATFYLLISSSFQTFNSDYESAEFNIWKMSLIKYPAEAILAVAKSIPTLRRYDGSPYEYPPSLPVVNDLLIKASMAHYNFPDLKKAQERIFKFKRKSANERAETEDHFVYTLYKILNQKMGIETEAFNRLFKIEYTKLADGLISGERTLDKIPKAITNK